MAASYVDSAAVVANAAGVTLDISALPLNVGDLLVGFVWFRTVQDDATDEAIQATLTNAGFFGVTLADEPPTGLPRVTAAFGYRWATGTETTLVLTPPDPTPRRCGIVCAEVAGVTLAEVDVTGNDETTAAQTIPRTGAVTLADDGIVVCMVAEVPDLTALDGPAGWTLGATDSTSAGSQCGVAYLLSAAGAVGETDWQDPPDATAWRTATFAISELGTVLATVSYTVTTGALTTPLPGSISAWPQPPEDPLDPETVAWPPDPETGVIVPAYPWGTSKGVN